MVQTVEDGLATETWTGFVYVMHWQHDQVILPLYIGKAERIGTKGGLSFNVSGIGNNQHAFGRWGYGIAYHIGDLSHAMLGGQAYQAPTKKYRAWAERLFRKMDPPELREPVFVSLVSWHENMQGPSGLPGRYPRWKRNSSRYLEQNFRGRC